MHQASNRLILLKLANERKNLTNPALLQLRSCAQIMSLSIGSVSLVGFGGSVGETKFTIIAKCLPEKAAVISQHYNWFPHNMTSEVEKRAQKFGTDDESLSGSAWCLWLDNANFQLIRNTTQTWLVARHQHGNSVLVPLTSFLGETSDGVGKCRLFSQANNACRLKLKNDFFNW